MVTLYETQKAHAEFYISLLAKAIGVINKSGLKNVLLDPGDIMQIRKAVAWVEAENGISVHAGLQYGMAMESIPKNKMGARLRADLFKVDEPVPLRKISQLKPYEL